ncbi:TonB-dependent siderophore receptor [Gilvimarinus chinensis]|uniref:TonB-dependent siderophore receptor n=1 Tax=Gilvimarinus chinensis TaxID=396005 RepID=UPI0003811ECC|nr:TonB-dependent siderophore receptor [Gilvimarinus chinensis]
MFRTTTTALFVAVASLHAQIALAEDQAVAERIEEVKIIGTNPERYQSDTTDSLTGVPVSFMELPRVVEIIPEQILLDQKATELEEGLRNVPGISLSDGFGGSNNDYYVRGFRRNTVYRNGIRRASNFRVNTSNLEQVLVVKGPASITYGQVEPGGLVDIRTKQPLDERRAYGEARLGSYDSQFLLADWSEPLGDIGAFRVNASSERSDTFRDFFTIERDTVSATARFDLGDNTQLTAEYEYRDEFRSFDRGTITVPTPDGREIVNRLIDVDISTRFGESFEEIDTEFEFASIGLEHHFNDSWSAQISGAYESSMSDDYQARPRAVAIFDADAPISEDGLFTGSATPEAVFDEASDQVFLARRSDGSREREITASYVQGAVNGEFTTGGIAHRLVVGADYRTYEDSRYFVATATNDGISVADGGNGPLFNLLNPIYGNLVKDVDTTGLPLLESERDETGVFINDYVSFTNQLSLLVGARFDSADTDGDGPADSVDEVSPQIALNYRPTDTLTLFGSYSEAFEPNSAFLLDADGVPSEHTLYDPEDSVQYEVGVKAQFFEGMLNLTAAAYDITKSNVLTVIDDQPELVDGQTSDGLELSVGGQPIVGMNLIAGYAYTNATIESGSNAGKRPRNVAEHTANLWASYEIQDGALQGVGTGIGAFYMGDRYGDSANSWSLGSYTLLDASLWYNLSSQMFGSDSTIRFQLAAKNLTDEEYYPASGGDLRVSIGTPRSIVGSVSVTF